MNEKNIYTIKDSYNYDIESLIKNDLVWGTHALGFRRLLNIFNSYHPFYNESLTEYTALRPRLI